ncbi:MAG: hypothetical protein GTN69_06755 [Armatimonadetes bacterium]|nr:hypothetical protein [Armatimonadota bacterium]NIO75571.1 hypothetical protein [Armatimonadota bacterium]
MSIDSALAGYCLFLAETAPWVLMLSAIGLALSCWGIVYVSYLSPEYKWIIRCVIVFLIAVIASCIHIAGILLVSLSAHMLSYGDQLIGQSDSLLPQSKVGLAGMARQVTVPILLKKRRNAQSQEG